MGIDIYLNGYEAHKARTKMHKSQFDQAVAKRDALPKSDETGHKAAQEEVDAAYELMYSGRVGYIRSSYNGSGLFRVLETIFGLDVAAYLFPGDWDGDVVIDGREFVLKVETLKQVAITALQSGRLALPWTEIFTEVTGERAPDPNETRVNSEAFGDSVFKLLSATGFGDKLEGGPSAPEATLGPDHLWYLTKGLCGLRDFGELAARLNEQGEKTFAWVSH
jgi:hypothetical protein